MSDLISVLLIDGRPVRRQRFIKSLADAGDIVVVGGISALEFYRETQEKTPARVVVLDGAFTDAQYYPAFLAETRAMGSAVVPIWDYPISDAERQQSDLLAGMRGAKTLTPDPRLLLFIETIRATARSQVTSRPTQTNHLEARTDRTPHMRPSEQPAARSPSQHQQSPRSRLQRPIVALGASTGGVQALSKVLEKWPEDCPPTLIVQHMPADFVPGFADRLNRLSPAHVKVAVDGDVLGPGMVYVAPGDDRHMRLASCMQDTISLVRGPPIAGHVPSVDALFHSLVPFKSRARCAILTGMGADGAEGLAEVRKAGGRTVAQSAESCVVFGMPREAIERDGADAVLPLERIAPWLLQDVSDIRS